MLSSFLLEQICLKAYNTPEFAVKVTLMNYLCKSLFLVLFLILFACSANGQCNYTNNTFQAGEFVSYKIFYNWGFIWIDAGTNNFKTEQSQYTDKNAFKITSIGRSHQKHDWFYKVRDTFEVFINPVNLAPYYFTRNTLEGDYRVKNEYTYQYPDFTIFSKTENNENGLKKDTVQVKKCTFDVLSIIYACRSIDFSSKKINETVPLNTIVDGKIEELFIRYLGKEVIVNKDLRKFNCNVFSVKMVEGTIFSGGEDLTVWVTNDRNQIPVYVEAKILVGSIKAFVDEIEGIKWPANYNIYESEK